MSKIYGNKDAKSCNTWSFPSYREEEIHWETCWHVWQICRVINSLNAYTATRLQSWTKVLGQIYICGAFTHAPNKFIYTCSSPPPLSPPTMLDTCTSYFSKVSTLYWGREGRQHILKRITVLFENSILKTPKINAITQVSQGILSTIVDFSKIVPRKFDLWFRSNQLLIYPLVWIAPFLKENQQLLDADARCIGSQTAEQTARKHSTPPITPSPGCAET